MFAIAKLLHVVEFLESQSSTAFVIFFKFSPVPQLTRGRPLFFFLEGTGTNAGAGDADTEDDDDDDDDAAAANGVVEELDDCNDDDDDRDKSAVFARVKAAFA
jgi:hypothetical protein